MWNVWRRFFWSFRGHSICRRHLVQGGHAYFLCAVLTSGISLAVSVVYACGVQAAEKTDSGIGLHLPQSPVPLFIRVPLAPEGGFGAGDVVQIEAVNDDPSPGDGQSGSQAELIGWVLPAADEQGTPAEGAVELLAIIPACRGVITPQNGHEEEAGPSDGESEELAAERVFVARRLPGGRLVGRPEEMLEDLGPASSGFSFIVDETRLLLLEDGKPLFGYNHAPVTARWVPEKDSRRTRACYIHPLFGLGGEVLTDDFPRDHYHHHGIFWTWPHVQIEGTEYDLWADRGIKQQFRRWLGLWAGPVAARFAVENGWYVGQRLVMLERIWVTVWRTIDAGRFFDFELFFQPTSHPITLWGAPGKSYGGMTVRFRVRPQVPVKITVPEGLTTEDLLETRLRWADLTSRFGEGEEESGATLFVRPDHPDFPPMWLTRHYGPLCVGWPGVEPRTLEAGRTVRLPYRLWIHRGWLRAEEIDRFAQAMHTESLARRRSTP